jgi:transposase, IS30 family
LKSYNRLSYEERVKISTFFSEGLNQTEIGKKLKRSTSTISRELKRFPRSYAPQKAQIDAESKLKRRNRKLETNQLLYGEVIEGLRKRWSPEQISETILEKFPGNEEMRISHETIYTYMYVLPRGELRSELISYLRQKKKSRYRRKGLYEKRGRIPEMISIEERPKAVENRSIPGAWEGDIILGKNHKSALGTLVERKTRAVILVKLKDKTAPKVRLAFEKAMKKIPEQMRTSLTYDQGHEMSEHKLFSENMKMKVYFCHPASPWERGTCENTNGLIRDYFPKGTDFNKVPLRELRRVQHQLNERPRKTLGFKTPKDVFNEEILKILR